MIFRMLLFLSIIWVVLSKSINKFNYPQQEVLNINSDIIENIFETNDFWFIKFYSPQCIHCKKIYNVIINLKVLIQSENKTKVYFGEVNCDDPNSVDICSKFEIKQIPQLMIFKGEEVVATYSNNINEEYFLKKWVYYVTLPLFFEINSEIELNAYKTDDNRFLTCSKNIHPQLLAAAENFSEENFFLKITNKELCNKLQIEENQLVVDGVYKHDTYDLNKINRESIKKFIRKNRFQLVTKTDHFNFFNLRSGGMNFVLLILNLNKSHSSYISEFTEYARKYRHLNEFVFGYIDGIVYEEALEFYGTHPSRYPQLIIFSSKPQEYYFESFFNLEHLDEIIDGVQNNKYTSHKEKFTRSRIFLLSLRKHLIYLIEYAFKKDIKSFIVFICSVLLISCTIIMIGYSIYRSLCPSTKICDIKKKIT